MAYLETIPPKVMMLILHIFLFPKVSFPYKECDATNRLDVLLLHELKETFCHLSEVCWEAVVVSQLFSLQT